MSEACREPYLADFPNIGSPCENLHICVQIGYLGISAALLFRVNLRRHAVAAWVGNLAIQMCEKYTVRPKVCPSRDLRDTQNRGFAPLGVFLGRPGGPWMIKIVPRARERYSRMPKEFPKVAKGHLEIPKCVQNFFGHPM